MTMFHHPQYWTSRVAWPMSLFEQTQYEADMLFYATFPAARDAAYDAASEQSISDHHRPVDFPSLSELRHDLRDLDISGTSISESFRGPTQELSYPQIHAPYSESLHLSHNQSQPSYPHPYSFEPTSQYIHQPHPIPVPTREPTSLVYQLSTSPQVNTDIQETQAVNSHHDSLSSFNQPLTFNFPNNCQLGVMRLDHLSDPSHLEPTLPTPSHPSPSETSHILSPPSTLPTTEFLLQSAQSPSTGLSSLPSRNAPEKKPLLACLFCRGRKIACGAPLPGSIKKTCNQCHKRGLQCYYPTESRRGMRRKKPPSDQLDVDVDTTTKVKRKKKSQK